MLVATQTKLSLGVQIRLTIEFRAVFSIQLLFSAAPRAAVEIA